MPRYATRFPLQLGYGPRSARPWATPSCENGCNKRWSVLLDTQRDQRLTWGPKMAKVNVPDLEGNFTGTFHFHGEKTYQKNEGCPMSIGESIKIQWTRGMANVKAFFKELSRTVAFVERGGDPRVLQTSLNLRLTGNPGMLGKTLVRHGQHCQHIYIYICVCVYVCMSYVCMYVM